ncbi:unnamed protein product [Lupinus luteus]|uniref:Serine-rich protein-like protein n=1 Tax=Lupinus luteus TaxID=3873 RepID=A0AAV1XBX9_LUPLU
MATSSSRTKQSGPVLRSLSPSHTRFCSYTTSKAPFSSPSSAFASSTNSSFSSPSSTFFNKSHHHHSHHRSASPTRLNFYSSASLSSGVRFSIDSRSISPNRPIPNQIITKNSRPVQKKTTCMCSPTTHPGSFRCSLHKNSNNGQADPYPSNRLSLNMRRSAMKNSLVRIGGVEGEWVKRALTALIRPSSHQQRRRSAFEPRPSRLSVMSKAEDL